MTLNGQEGPENVGILMAQQKGYFTDERLSVSVFTPVSPARPVQYVATRQDDLGVTQAPQLVIGRDKGAPVVAVGSLVNRATAAMIWLKESRIVGIADLRGKTIGIPGVPFQKDFLENVLGRAGLTLDDVEVKNVGYELVPALVGGRVDAIFGGSWNLEGAELEARGLEPAVIHLQGLGVPPYDESLVIARADRVSEEPGLIEDFMSAVSRGTAAAVADPRAAVEAIEEAGLGGSKVSRRALKAEVEATLPLLSKSGYMYPEEAIGLVDWMRGEGMIEHPLRPSQLLTNEYASWQP
ncbi:MAG TPA: ABC transporter substrate-binding protein [Solirubrobacterales bacterium]|nr:ABC transporter substrate-binding protein [Solirubrobacterales bacterium]